MSIGDVNSTARGSGARYNDGKVAFDLIPGLALEDCARVFDYGRNKYAAWNWAKGMRWMVPFGCLLRHMYAWARGEDNDPESGLPHLGHAMCNLVMLTTFARTYPEGDDRPKGLFDSTPIGTARQIYDETSAIAEAQDARLYVYADTPAKAASADLAPKWLPPWLAEQVVPAESSYLASFSPNGSRIATVDEVAGLAESLTAEQLADYGIGDVTHIRHSATNVSQAGQHPMNAEAIRDHDERLNGPEDQL